MTSQELKGAVLGEAVGSKLLYVEIVDHSPALVAVTEGVLNFVFGRSVLGRHILALIVIFFQASFFSILLINNKAYNENTYLPSLIFGLLCFFSFDLLSLSPELIASALLLLALNNIFKEIEFRIDRDAIVLNIGVFLGLASLFVFSYTLFLPGTIFILIAFARASLRKILLLLFGYGLVHAGLFTLYYFYDHSSDLWTQFYVANLAQQRGALVSTRTLLILGAVPTAYFVLSLFMLTREARFTKYQSQLFQVLFLWLFIAALQVWLTPEITPHSFTTFLPSLAYFVSHYILLIRRRKLAEFMLWILMLGLISMNFLARNHFIDRVDYAGLFPGKSAFEGNVVRKRILIVGDDLGLYKNNKLAGYFLDWNLSKRFFEDPGNLGNITKIHKSFTEDPPDVIVDENDLMEPILERLPTVKMRYQKDGKIYRRLSN